jgi:hypothetical protein
LGSQVIAFLRPLQHGSDWSPEEIAELYRIEHALLQARISVQTDRGATDEGDPWFVFCRADGEVLVHITRFDGQYRLYSSALSSPLTGRLFTELSKSFVQQIPLQFPLRRTDGAQLFVHPAAMLAIIIGTIFAASDDVYLLSADSDRARGQVDDHVAQVDGGGLKMALQGAFHKYIEGFLGSARSELTSQSSYLNVICAIATFIIGTSVSSDVDSAHFGLLAGLESSEDQSGPTHVAMLSLDDDGLGWRWDDANPKEQIQSNHVAETKVLVLDDEQVGTANSLILSRHSENGNLGDDLSSNKLHFDVIADREKIAGGESNQVSENAKLAHGDDSFTQNASPSFFQLTQDSSAPPPAKIALAQDSASAAQDSLAAFSVDQLLHHVFAPSTMPVDLENHLISLVSTSAPAGGQEPSPNAVISATPAAYPMFDAAAQSTVMKFLMSNPDFKVVYDHQNVIVTDGHDDGGSQPATVQIWELQTGATIAIVGHTDPVAHV